MQVIVTFTPKALNELVNLLTARTPNAPAGSAVLMAASYVDLVEAELVAADAAPPGVCLVGTRAGVQKFRWAFETGLLVAYEMEETPGWGLRPARRRVKVIGFRATRPIVPPQP